MEWYHKLIIVYLIIINIAGIGVTIYDKLAAKASKRRISEISLILFAAFGSGLSMYITMHIIRHKTKHFKFMFGIPAILIIEMLLIIGIYYMV